MKHPLEDIEIPKVIATNRLELRLLNFEMAADFNSSIHASLAEFNPWFDWMHPTPPTLKETQEHALVNIKEQLNKEAFHFGMYLKGTNTMVGRISLDKDDPNIPAFNIGYWTHSAHVGNGYMTEALFEICDFSINHLKSRRVDIYHDSENLASKALIQKIVQKFGFEKLAVLKNKHRRKGDGSLRHDVYYSFTQGD
tara:strand:- start:46833 stop:47420 length:588 start_codon:yes stop_codon:yes gene_type:complete